MKNLEAHVAWYRELWKFSPGMVFPNPEPANPAEVWMWNVVTAYRRMSGNIAWPCSFAKRYMS